MVTVVGVANANGKPRKERNDDRSSLQFSLKKSKKGIDKRSQWAIMLLWIIGMTQPVQIKKEAQGKGVILLSILGPLFYVIT